MDAISPTAATPPVTAANFLLLNTKYVYNHVNSKPRTPPPTMMPPMSLLMSTRKDKVARYIEKRRRRVFEKTVRYASRKAYAESRPRIKGRFARRDEIAPDGTILPAVLFKEGLISEEEMKLMEDVAKEKHGTMANGGVRTGRTVQPTELPMNLPRKRGTTLPDLPPAGAAGGEAA